MKNLFAIINHSVSFRQLLHSGGLTFLYRISGLFLNFLITFFITKNYGDGIYGNYSLVFTMLQASTMIFALGLPNAVISYLGLHKIDDHFSQFLLKKGLKILLFAAVVPSAFYFIFKDVIAVGIFNNDTLIPYIGILAFALPFSIFHEFILNFFIATKNFLKFNIFMFVVPNLFFLLLLVIFSVTEESQSLTILFYAIAIVITLTVECFFAFQKHEKIALEKMRSKEIIRFASPMMLSSLMLFLLNWTDVFMLGAMASENEVGIYNLAYKLASLAMLVIISMNVVLMPKISELHRSGRISELHQTIKKATWIIIAATVPIVIFLVVFSEQLLHFFGPQFVAGRTALIIISVGVLLNVMTGNVDQILNMTGNQKTLKSITIFGFVINAVLNFVLIPHYGINGSAAASLFTNVAFNFACLFYIKKRLGFYTFV